MHPLLKDATDEQREAIQHGKGPAVVSAVPGAGKCIIGSSLVWTNSGLLYIHDIPNKYRVGDNNRCHATVLGCPVNLHKKQSTETSHWFDMGVHDTISIKTETGCQITGTPEHPVVVLDKHGDLVFKRLDEIVPGDVAAVIRGSDLWGTNRLDPDLAYVLGLLVGDGSLSKKDHSFGLSRKHKAMEHMFKAVIKQQFGVEKINTREKSGTNSVTHWAYSKTVKTGLRNLGLAMVRSPFRYVPETIMQGTKETVIWFLRGLFDTEASVCGHAFEYTTASKRLVTEVQALLLNLGVRSALNKKPVKKYPDNDYYRLHISGDALRCINNLNIFRLHEEKKVRLAEAATKTCNPNKDLIYGQSERVKRIINNHLRGRSFWDGRNGAVIETNGTHFRLNRYTTGRRTPSRQAIERILYFVPKTDPDREYLENLISNYILDPIIKVTNEGKNRVYDFTVPSGHAFVANGFVNHNTRVLTYRTAYLIDHGIDPSRIVGITFTNRAANEMKSRISKLIGPGRAKLVWMSTFHSFCVRLLRNDPVVFGVDPRFGIADEHDAKAFMTQAMANVTGKTVKELKSSSDNVNAYRSLMSKCKDKLMLPSDIKNGDMPNASKLRAYYAEYQKILTRNNRLDFDDLIMKVTMRLQRDLTLQEKYNEALHYLMVDEYQDTNYAQFELIRCLTHLRENVFVVYDIDQSLYGWRGAEAEQNEGRFFDTFPDTKIYKLQTNFRSSPGIAAVANQVIAKNARKIEKQIVTHKQHGIKPLRVELENQDEEAAFIVEDIVALVRDRKYEWKDNAVIYRTRNQSRALEEVAIKHNVPFRVVGALGFYNRAIVKDILAYAQLLVNHKDDASFVRIHNKPPRGIGAANFARFANVAEENSLPLMKVLRKGLYKDHVSGGALEGVRQLKSMYKKLIDLDPKQVGIIIDRIVEWSGYKRYLDSLPPSRSEQQLEDLEGLVDAAYEFDDKQGTGLRRFLEHASLMQNGSDDEDENKVLFMTGHASKGLEFKNVYVAGVVEDLLPLKPRSDDDEPLSSEAVRKHYEEERRIFFVAVTRAEERLTVCSVRSRRFHNDFFSCSPSRFLREAEGTLDFKMVKGTPYSYATSAFKGAYNKRRTGNKSSYANRPVARPVKTASRFKSKVTIKDGGADEIIRLKREGQYRK